MIFTRKKRKNLYKYDSMNEPEHLMQILLENTLWLSDPKKFNDPFDLRSLISVGKSHKEQKKSKEYIKSVYKKYYPTLNSKTLEQKAERALQKIINSNYFREKYLKYLLSSGVCCLSGQNDNLLMWARYSIKHTGYCLEFSTNPPGTIFSKAERIQYKNLRPILKLYEYNKETFGKLSILTKSKDWKYEDEWRLTSKKHGKLDFPPEQLTGLIIGCKMDKSHIDQIKKWVSQRKLPLMIKKAKMNVKKSKLDIVPLDD